MQEKELLIFFLEALDVLQYVMRELHLYPLWIFQ